MSRGSVRGFLFVFLPLETKEQFQAVRAIVVVTVCQDDKVQIKERAEEQHLETSAKKNERKKRDRLEEKAMQHALEWTHT